MVDVSERSFEEGRTGALQKFPVIAKEIGELPGKRFALIVDEAHSSQSGESTKSLKAVLASRSLEDAEAQEADAESPEEELESRIVAEIESRGPLPNLFPVYGGPKMQIVAGKTVCIVSCQRSPEPVRLQ